MTSKRLESTARPTYVTFFSLAIVLAGCAQSHEPPAVIDAGGRADSVVPPLPDVVDAGVEDSFVPPMQLCPLGDGVKVAGVAGCALTSTGAVVANARASLTVLARDCFCAEPVCSEPVVEPGRLIYDLEVCDALTDCEACMDDSRPPPLLPVSCPVPSIAQGRYQVVVNDVFVADLQALPAAVVNPARPLCSLRDVSDPVCDLVEVGELKDGVLCHPQLIDVGGQPSIAVDVGFPLAGCDVRVVGSEIQLQLFESTCGGETTTQCYPPPLSAGEYTFLVNGRPVEAVIYVEDIDPRPLAVICEPL